MAASPARQIANATRARPNSSTAPAEALNQCVRSGLRIQPIRRTDSGAGVLGPRISATSTTEIE
jgi:hypothetical protein